MDKSNSDKSDSEFKLTQSDFVTAQKSNNSFASEAWNLACENKALVGGLAVGTAIGVAALALGRPALAEQTVNRLVGGTAAAGATLEASAGSAILDSAARNTILDSTATNAALDSLAGSTILKNSGAELDIELATTKTAAIDAALEQTPEGGASVNAAAKLNEAGAVTALPPNLELIGAGASENNLSKSLETALNQALSPPSLDLVETNEVVESAKSAAQKFAPQVSALTGDIAKIPSDAIVTPINSGGAWFGALDNVIQRAGGSQFHAQAMKAMPLIDGQTVVANQIAEHSGAFKNVVFVIDDLQMPLKDVVSAGLKAADEAGYKTITMPAMRTGVMMGVVEKTAQETVDQMAAGVKTFMESGPKSLTDIKFVVYRNPDILEKLNAALAQ